MINDCTKIALSEQKFAERAIFIIINLERGYNNYIYITVYHFILEQVGQLCIEKGCSNPA